MSTPLVADKKSFGKINPSMLLGLYNNRIVGHGVLNGHMSIVIYVLYYKVSLALIKQKMKTVPPDWAQAGPELG